MNLSTVTAFIGGLVVGGLVVTIYPTMRPDIEPISSSNEGPMPAEIVGKEYVIPRNFNRCPSLYGCYSSKFAMIATEYRGDYADPRCVLNPGTTIRVTSSSKGHVLAEPLTETTTTETEKSCEVGQSILFTPNLWGEFKQRIEDGLQEAQKEEKIKEFVAELIAGRNL